MSSRTIKLKKYQDIILEYEAGGAITPGALLQLESTNTVAVNATAGGPAATMVALEDELQGKSTQDAYAAEDPVQCWYMQSGEEALILVDSGFDPDIGDLLEASTGGQLRAHNSGVAQFQVIGKKVVDGSGNHRVPVRKL